MLLRLQVITMAAALGLGGCKKGPEAMEAERADRAAARAGLESVRELERAIDEMEARLWSNRATARLYAELAERHRRVSALACQNAQMHSEGMALHSLRDRRGRLELARRRDAEAAKAAAARPSGD